MKEWVGRANVRLKPLRLFGGGCRVVVEQFATWRDAETGEESGRATVATVFEVSKGLVAGITRHDELETALASAGLDLSDRLR